MSRLRTCSILCRFASSITTRLYPIGVITRHRDKIFVLQFEFDLQNPSIVKNCKSIYFLTDSKNLDLGNANHVTREVLNITGERFDQYYCLSWKILAPWRGYSLIGAFSQFMQSIPSELYNWYSGSNLWFYRRYHTL